MPNKNPTTNRERRLLCSIAATAFVAMAIFWVGVRYTESEVLTRRAEDSAHRWAVFLRDDLPGLSGILAGAALTDRDVKVIELAQHAGEIFRHKFFDANGVIVHASRKDDIGKTNTKPYFENLVRKGIAYSKIETDEDFGANRRVVSESYVPIMDGERFLGAIEVYADVTVEAATLARWGNIALFGMLAFIILVGLTIGELVRRYVARIMEAYRALDRSRNDLEAAQTRLVQAKQDADRLRDVALDANQAKSDFLASMSHELRTPLNAIIGYSELLQEEAADRQDQRLTDDLTKVRNAGKHLLGLVNGVLDLSKIDSGKMEVMLENVSLDEFLMSIEHTVHPVVTANGNQLGIFNESVVGSLVTDPQMLRQILINLLGNAAKFTENGEISLRISQDCAASLHFTITDTGIGISAEKLEKIFDPFVQADSAVSSKYGGTGLGLALCSRFANLLNGELDVQSTDGVGTRFTLTLPIEGAAVLNPHALSA